MNMYSMYAILWHTILDEWIVGAYTSCCSVQIVQVMASCIGVYSLIIDLSDGQARQHTQKWMNFTTGRRSGRLVDGVRVVVFPNKWMQRDARPANGESYDVCERAHS